MHFTRTVSFVVVLFACSVQPATLVFPPYLHSYGIRKATPQHLFMFFGPTTFFDNPQGLATTMMISRDDPKTNKDDDEVVAYGVNAGRNQIIYNTSMYSLVVYGKKGSGVDQFQDPRGIVAEPHGNVFVADSGNSRIVHLFNPKKEVRWVRAYDGRIKNDPGFNGPQQVALDEFCRVYVTDTKNRRVVIFDTAQTFLQVISGEAGANFENGPTTLAVADGRSRWSYFKDEGIVFCADQGGTRLWKFNFAGAMLRRTSMPKGYRADYGAIDYYHNFYVTDPDKGCIVKFDHNLNLLDIFGSPGTGDNQFTEPRGIAVYKRFGQLFVAEKEGAQYYWVGTDLKSKDLAWHGDSSCVLSVTLTEFSYVSLFNAAGSDTVRYLKRRMMFPGGARVAVPPVPEKRFEPGEKFTLRIEPTYSSYTFFHQDYPVTIVR